MCATVWVGKKGKRARERWRKEEREREKEEITLGT